MINLTLFLTFFKIGLFTFGGGYAMIPMIQQDVVGHGWLSAERLIDFIAISESTPGPFAVNIATFVGIEEGGLIGAISATIGVVLPSFLIILLVARFFMQIKDHPVVQGALSGLRPAVVGLIAAAALSILLVNLFPALALTDPSTWLGGIQSIKPVSLVIAGIVLMVSVFWKKLHPIWLIGLSGLLGIAAGALGLL